MSGNNLIRKKVETLHFNFSTFFCDESIAFSPKQQQCLSTLAPTLEGKTLLQQNPYPPSTLAWATWIMQGLGGWSGYKSQKPPGITTLVRGIYQFESTFFGWKLTLGLLVCTP